MANRLSEEVISKIPILYNELHNKSEVARRLNISVDSVNKYLTVIDAAPEEIKKKKTRTKITDEIIEQINEKYKQTKSMKKVAEELGISAATVKKYLSEEDICRINAYHKEVFEKISPLLSEEEAAWLKKETRPL